LDDDGDGLPTTYELTVTKTRASGENAIRSATEGTVSNLKDSEVYAGGPIEAAALLVADTSEDWANPGTNNKHK
jgi:hypothetical protein